MLDAGLGDRQLFGNLLPGRSDSSIAYYKNDIINVHVNPPYGLESSLETKGYLIISIEGAATEPGFADDNGRLNRPASGCDSRAAEGNGSQCAILGDWRLPFGVKSPPVLLRATFVRLKETPVQAWATDV